MITEEAAIENLNAAIIKECRSLLITCDYKGKESKEIALATLEKIAFNRGYAQARRDAFVNDV